jgi:hypothetical protein
MHVIFCDPELEKELCRHIVIAGEQGVIGTDFKQIFM